MNQDSNVISMKLKRTSNHDSIEMHIDLISHDVSIAQGGYFHEEISVDCELTPDQMESIGKFFLGASKLAKGWNGSHITGSSC